jgi:hypothetical protein
MGEIVRPSKDRDLVDKPKDPKPDEKGRTILTD